MYFSFATILNSIHALNYEKECKENIVEHEFTLNVDCESGEYNPKTAPEYKSYYNMILS